ncbi:hypothetical protein H261_01017 [Paramagnetospirillum caucaseum]|uniref:Uncharacterized protein n=1 Tax=Paramagnetospirillum caucaseum TaxID=1244869 RepID=M2YFL4_9PROT|nr:hypothetical protein [Paramagnetospirillum caucaseum]EME71786.1 hypothetical protein H261_01017 [Paramagnetospirillum caucaseum]
MAILRMMRVAMALSLMAGLSGCAVAELAAHGVKEWDKRNRGGEQAAQAEAQPQSQPQARAEEEPPPPVRAPASPSGRSSVTVEELPAR